MHENATLFHIAFGRPGASILIHSGCDRRRYRRSAPALV